MTGQIQEHADDDEVFHCEKGSRTEKLGRAATRTAALGLYGGRTLHGGILDRKFPA
ncbi:hypothetical protein [Nocardia sp. BMG111209]|uniref:hypothetical protein n=1 Tax=Nocardia sp. BMG111209 TaxID=1160137 RepID=UPI0003A95CA5|nr:hypothetical protein [Nocardia sp. BMG111209]